MSLLGSAGNCDLGATWTGVLGSWGMKGGGQGSVPKQKRPNQFRVASRPTSSREGGNFLEGKTYAGKAGRLF
jgi:hypothetical protein